MGKHREHPVAVGELRGDGSTSGGEARGPQLDDEPPLIQEFLRQARKGYTGRPEPITGHAGHRPPGLSQFAVADRLGISTRLYQDWEAAGRPIPVQRLDGLAKALGLDSRRRDELWFIVTGGYPPRGPSRPDPDAVSGWTSYLHALPVPALAVDGTWRVLESNDAWRQLFAPVGQTPPANLLRFVLFSPYARRLCGEWKAGWATAFLRQLRLEAQTTADKELRGVISEVRLNPELARLWQAANESTRVALHHDGQVCLLRPPANGSVRVRMLVSSPAHDPRRRLLTFLPDRVDALRGDDGCPLEPGKAPEPGAAEPVAGPLAWLAA
jgi:transcriptional regulator with XRE-family HTH domain